MSRRLKYFLRSNKRQVKFIFFFIIFFFLGQILYHLIEPYTVSYVIPKFITEVSSKIINIITPNEKTVVIGGMIHSGNFMLMVALGCEGFEAILLVAAGILAFSDMRFRDKILGVSVGSFIIYVINLFRIVALYYTSKYKPTIFEIMHIYVGQTIIILIGCLFFLYWVNNFAISRREDQ